VGFSRKPNGISFAAIGFILHPALRSCLQDLIFCWQFFGFLRRIIGARSTVVFTMDVGDLQIAENRIPLLSDPSPKELWRIVLKITLKNTIVKAKVRIGYTDFLRIVQTDSWRSIVINRSRLSTSSEVAYNCNQGTC
jgi:hypothetical protein